MTHCLHFSNVSLLYISPSFLGFGCLIPHIPPSPPVCVSVSGLIFHLICSFFSLSFSLLRPSPLKSSHPAPPSACRQNDSRCGLTPPPPPPPVLLCKLLLLLPLSSFHSVHCRTNSHTIIWRLVYNLHFTVPIYPPCFCSLVQRRHPHLTANVIKTPILNI